MYIYIYINYNIYKLWAIISFIYSPCIRGLPMIMTTSNFNHKFACFVGHVTIRQTFLTHVNYFTFAVCVVTTLGYYTQI